MLDMYKNGSTPLVRSVNSMERDTTAAKTVACIIDRVAHNTDPTFGDAIIACWVESVDLQPPKRLA